MRINTNITALNVLNTLKSTSGEFGKSVGRLSSGFRINSAGDDAAGLGIANKLRSDVRALGQAARNAEQATSALQVAEGGVQTISTILDRMKELAMQAGSDNTDTAGRTTIAAEITELAAEVDDIVNSTQFGSDALLDGNYAGEFRVRASGAADDIVAVSGAALDLSAVVTAVAGLDVSDVANSTTALATIDTQIDTVNTAFSAIGAAMNRFDYARQNTNVAMVNFAAAESVIRDVDMASEITRLTKFQILQQAGQAMLGQANSAPQGVLRLLG